MVAYIGIDNGVTGSLAYVDNNQSFMVKTPIINQQSYTKQKSRITRIDYATLVFTLLEWGALSDHVKVILERPYVNPIGFRSTMSAMRSLEATLIAVEHLNLPYMYVDSKSWQRSLLPKGLKGSADLKTASKDIGIRLFPSLEAMIVKHGDADSLLIAEWARRSRL